MIAWFLKYALGCPVSENLILFFLLVLISAFVVVSVWNSDKHGMNALWPTQITIFDRVKSWKQTKQKFFALICLLQLAIEYSSGQREKDTWTTKVLTNSPLTLTSILEVSSCFSVVWILLRFTIKKIPKTSFFLACIFQYLLNFRRCTFCYWICNINTVSCCFCSCFF